MQIRGIALEEMEYLECLGVTSRGEPLLGSTRPVVRAGIYHRDLFAVALEDYARARRLTPFRLSIPAVRADQATEGGKDAEGPDLILSPQGDRFAFLRGSWNDSGKSPLSLWVSDLDGTRARAVVAHLLQSSGPNATFYDVRWQPDGRHVSLVIADRARAEAQLYLATV